MTKIFLLLSLLFFSLIATATNFNGAASNSTGGAGRGTAEPTDSLYLNPAMVSQLSSKYFSFNYAKNNWGLSIADNGREVLFPAGLQYVRKETNTLDTQQISLLLSQGFWQNFSIGANISMLEYNLLVPVDQKFKQTTGDIGFAFITDVIGIGLVANKVFSTDTDLVDALEVQKTIGLGSNYTYMNFIRFRFDIESGPENKTDRLIFMGGTETFVNDWIIVRLGYQNNNVLGRNYISGGLGFTGPQFGLNYGYISNVADKADDKHSIDLGIPF